MWDGVPSNSLHLTNKVVFTRPSVKIVEEVIATPKGCIVVKQGIRVCLPVVPVKFFDNGERVPLWLTRGLKSGRCVHVGPKVVADVADAQLVFAQKSLVKLDHLVCVAVEVRVVRDAVSTVRNCSSSQVFGALVDAVKMGLTSEEQWLFTVR